MNAVVEREASAGRETFVSLAPLFRYPDAAYRRCLDEAAALLGSTESEASRDLRRFADDLCRGDLADQQMTFTTTFDLAPACSPYAGIHVFGEESAGRARLLIALRGVYRSREVTADERELPDHLSELLAAASCLDDEEWNDLRALILLPALQKMNDSLQTSSSSFRHLVAAALHLTAASLSERGNA